MSLNSKIGPNPYWGFSQTFVLKKVIAPDLALLRIAVNDETSNKGLSWNNPLPVTVVDVFMFVSSAGAALFAH